MKITLHNRLSSCFLFTSCSVQTKNYFQAISEAQRGFHILFLVSDPTEKRTILSCHNYNNNNNNNIIITPSPYGYASVQLQFELQMEIGQLIPR